MALERGAARQVLDARDLVAAVALYFDQPELRRAAGAAAHTLVTDNRGALKRTLEHVERTLLARGFSSRTDFPARAYDRAGTAVDSAGRT